MRREEDCFLCNLSPYTGNKIFSERIEQGMCSDCMERVSPMNSLKAYHRIVELVTMATKEWNGYNEPQKTFVALQIIELLGKIEDAAIYLATMDHLHKHDDLYLLVMRYA